MTIDPDSDLNMAAALIRELVPIAGDIATDAECEARAALIDRMLEVFAPDRADERHWYDVTLIDERRVGRWAGSWQEAVLGCAMWWGVSVVSVGHP